MRDTAARASDQELPMFDPAERVLEGYDLDPELRPPGPITTEQSFIRKIHIWSRPVERINIEELLRKTDEELELVALACGALVVEHEWGIMPCLNKPAPLYESRNVTGMPRGHRVVARVATIVEASGTDNQQETDYIERCRQRYLRQKAGSVYQADASPKQFMRGTKLADFQSGQKGDPLLWYVDIEPALRNL